LSVPKVILLPAMTTSTVTPNPSNRIAEIRKARGITALELAATMGVRETTIFRWQSGENQPALPMMHRLAEALGCTLDELFPAPAKKARKVSA
jgi:transcriptional regulator with XRE-family HTH domain